jgi:hypothetical protein
MTGTITYMAIKKPGMSGLSKAEEVDRVNLMIDSFGN